MLLVEHGRTEGGEWWVTASEEFPVSCEAAFRATCDPRLLNAMTPRWFQLKPNPSTGPFETFSTGDEISYRSSLFAVPFTWRSRVLTAQFPERFEYEQSQGPFRSFRHTHEFERTESGTKIIDTIRYRLRPLTSPVRTVVTILLTRILTSRFRALRARLR